MKRFILLTNLRKFDTKDLTGHVECFFSRYEKETNTNELWFETIDGHTYKLGEILAETDNEEEFKYL